MEVIARVRSLWHGLIRREKFEAEMMEEFRHHMELRTADLMRRGLSAAAARRQARLEFGHDERYREAARASRGLRLFDQTRFSWLDVKLGLRMLTKYPVLSLVSVLGMAVAIAIGAGAFGAIYSMMDPHLPLPGGERVVALHNATRNPGNPDRQSLHDFVLWREELGSVRDLSAFMTDQRNLVMADGSVALVRIAQMSASGFRVARVAPVLGRPLLDEDEEYGAAPVVVIAHEEWQSRFDGDPSIIGRPVKLGMETHTVIGVMPAGFRFPINHRYWVPLRLNAAEHARGAGPSIEMFGTLADGATLEQAQAELTSIGLRTAAQYPDTHDHLRPRVMRYTLAFMDLDSPMMKMVLHGVQIAISLLLVLVSVNVAVLIYARTATRTGEIAVRSALGASRRRVVTQLFAEALVMSTVAAVIGLAVAAAGLAQAEAMLDQDFPFWLHFGLTPGLIAYVAGLAILAGVIVGVVPALRATGRQLQGGLQQLSARGSQMQLGRMWTAMIVMQVAIAVAVLPFALYVAGQSLMRGTADAGYPADEFLRADLSLERQEAPPSNAAEAYEERVTQQFRASAAELIRRLEADPAVAGVSFANAYPGGGRFTRVEIEGQDATSARQTAAAPTTSVPTASSTSAPSMPAASGFGGVVLNSIDVDLFKLMEVPVLAGRQFTAEDARAGAAAVLVDRLFAERIAVSGSVIGRRVRTVTLPPSWGPEGPREIDPSEIVRSPWYEIVGVVPDFTIQNDFDPANPKLYRPLSLADAPTDLSLAVRMRPGTDSRFGGRLREITAAVDPALQLRSLQSASIALQRAQAGLRFIALGVAAVTFTVMLLSAAGIYAMMSFTVARRRREIGIRAALGAAPHLVIRGIFARAAKQLAAGIAAGLVVAVALEQALGGGPLRETGIVLLPIVALVMMVVGMLASFVPARRCLSVQPTEALREE